MHQTFKWLINYTIIFLLFSIYPSLAHADYWARIAVLACNEQNNQFAVRFGVISNENPIDKIKLEPTSKAIEDAWKHMSIKLNGTCALLNKQKILISNKSAQSFPYGMGGADPDVFFSLKINDKYIFYNRIFYEGYSIEKYDLQAIMYDGKNLIEDVSSRLVSEYPLSKEENKEYLSDQVAKDHKKQLEDNLSNFCKEIKPILTKEAKYSEPESIPDGFLSNLEMDINNDGKIDKIYRIGGGNSDCGVGCGTHSFDGSFLIIFSKGLEKIQNFLQTIHRGEYAVDDKQSIKEIPEWNALFVSQSLSGNSSSYIYNTPITYNGKNYISTFEVSEKAVPRRSVGELTKDNKLITLCKYPE